MKNKFWLNAAIVLIIFLAITSCKKNDGGSKNVVGYLYTSTNGEGINDVVRFSRMEDGSLENERAYTTK